MLVSRPLIGRWALESPSQSMILERLPTLITALSLKPQKWLPRQNFNQTYAGFEFTFDIQPGYVFTITDGVMTRTHTITSFEITEVNPDTNIVSGIAAPNSQVEINVYGETDFQETTADGYGDWSIDFTDIYDIGPDSWVQSRQEDNDGDYTLDGLAHNCYYVTVSTDPSGGGSVDVPPERCAGGYHLGRVAELTATAAPGYVFAGWSGDASGTDNPLLVTMDADKTVTANFIQNEYTLNVISAHGTVAKNPNQATYHEGDVVQLTATPNVGWYFAKWTGDLMSNVNPDFITIHGNTTVTANYTRPMFWVLPNGIWPNDDAFIETIKWPLGVEVTLTIDDPVTPESPDYGPFTEITGIDPWGHSYASARFDFTFDILPGYVISISDGVITKTHTVTSLEVTDVNPNTNIVTGVAAPYSQVEIDEPDFQEVIADGNGNWSIDFSDIYDIVPETFVEAMQWDNDDDLTMAGKYAFEHNQPPIANAGGAYSGYAGSIIELNASASSDPDGDALTYEWDLDNDGQYDDASGITVATSFSQVGSHIVGLRVTDDGGLSDTDTATVTVLPWTLKGFYQPVDMNGVYNTVKGGSTVPLKFEIFAGSPS